MTKKDLALRISEKLGVEKKLAREAVDTLFTAMSESMAQGNRIEIGGFGVLGVKDTRHVPSRKKSYYRASARIKRALHTPPKSKDITPKI